MHKKLLQLENQLLFFFSGLGVFNGLLLSLYILFILKPRRLANIFFGLLILVLSIRIGKSIFYFFLRDLSKIYLQIGLSACFLIGPFLVFYIKTTLKPIEKLTLEIKLQLISIVLIIILAGLIYPYPTYPNVWNTYYVNFIYLEWMTYVFVTGFILKNIIYKSITNPKKLSITESWLIIIFLANLIICTAYFGAFYLKFTTLYIIGPITFSLLFYGLSLFLLLQKNSKILFQPLSNRYSYKKIQIQEASKLLDKLDELMHQKSLFKDPNLKLKDLAKELSISGHYLSQLLNDNLGKSFSLYINEYRIQAAEKLLIEQPNYVIEAIAEEVGFNSKSAFYATFKKIKGTTPAKVRSQGTEIIKKLK